MADDLQNLNQTPNSKDPVQQGSKQSSKQQELKKESLEDRACAEDDAGHSLQRFTKVR